MPLLLVVDDEPAIQHAFQRAFKGAEIEIRVAGTAAEALRLIRDRRPDVVVLDIHLPDATNLDAFHRIQQVDARIPVIMITGHGTTELAIEAMKEGAFDYLLKPLELGELRELIERAVRSSRRMSVPAAVPDLEPATDTGDLLVGRCPAMQEVYKSIGRIARQDVTVLVVGETGTGKELIARAIYQHSDRANLPFVAINCGAIPENLLESELFGHEKGAFTGADRKRIGRFEQANNGTVFLDEIGELPLLSQVKMLRILQEQSFERVGGEETVRTNVRIIAATNANLEKMVEEGRFRKDLFFRLNVFNITLPPLRERGEDIQLLVEHFLHRYAQELGSSVRSLANETQAALLSFHWPGNIRELQSVIKQSLLRAHGDLLLVEDLPAAVTGRLVATQNASSGPPSPVHASLFDWDAFVAERIASNEDNLYAQGLEIMEKEVLKRVLRHTNGNQLQAAKILGITRGSLRTKIRTHGIKIDVEIWSDDEMGDS